MGSVPAEDIIAVDETATWEGMERQVAWSFQGKKVYSYRQRLNEETGFFIHSSIQQCQTAEIKLRRVPIALTRGWGGTGVRSRIASLMIPSGSRSTIARCAFMAPMSPPRTSEENIVEIEQ